MTNKELIYNNIINRGYNTAVACGIMANMYFESGFNPQVVGDNGTSYGLCQWHNNRRIILLTKPNYHLIETQIDYLFEELNKSYASIRNIINNSGNNIDDAYQVAYMFCKKFEIPADTENQAIKRGNYAKELFREYNEEKLKSNEEIANEVIEGLWGNGDSRRKLLESASYDYNAIQKIVNNKLKKNKLSDTFQNIFFKKSNEEIANEVIKGLWKNGNERKKLLEDAGYNYQEIQSIVNKKLKAK